MSCIHNSRWSIANFNTDEVCGKIMFFQTNLVFMCMNSAIFLTVLVLEINQTEFETLGEYYHPYITQNESFESNDRPAGDLGNIKIDNMGVAEVKLTLPKYLTLYGDYSIIGRSLIIDYKKDDYKFRINKETHQKPNSTAGIAYA
ncbi:hypothetical protein HZS_5645, partial [Henneguya salminicola]